VQRQNAIVFLLLTTVALLPQAGCAPPEPVPLVSLADLLDPAEPPGPWRALAPLGLDPAWFAGARGIVVERDGARRSARKLSQENPAVVRRLARTGALIQTARAAVLARPVDLRHGQRLAASIRLAKPAGTLQLVLRRDGAVVARTGAAATRDARVHLDLVVPEGGADLLEIVHRQPRGSVLRLVAIDLLLLDRTAPPAEVARARRFLELGGDDPSLLFRGAAVRRLVRVSRFGASARCALLVPGDTLVLAHPPGASGCRLAFRAVRPLDDEGLDIGLHLERATDGGWDQLWSWPTEALAAGAWVYLTVDLPHSDGSAGRLRLVHSGKEGAIGITEPVLLPPAGRAEVRPNLVLVVLDTLRADRLGCYGYTDRPTSARLDRALAEWGFARFSNAYSASPWTVPATAKFMTSRYLDFHGTRRIPDQATTLAEFLRARGYYCMAFTGGGMVAVPGMEQGFHQYRWSSGVGKVEDSFPAAGRWLEHWSGGPFFLMVHTYETHRPYTRDTFCRDLPRGRLGDLGAGQRLFNRQATNHDRLTAEEQACVQAAYDGGVLAATEATADLLETLERTGRRGETVVVILSDHGEELWDHHQLSGAHGHSLFGEMLDVPLLIHGPATAGEGLRTLDTPVSTVDLPPTAAALLGLNWDSEADGVSLAPLLEGGTVSRTVPILADLQRAPLHPEIAAQACIVEGGLKYIEPLAGAPAVRPGPLSGLVPLAEPGLFRLADDPGERRNLVAAEPEVARRMGERLRRALSRALSPDDLAADLDPVGERPLGDELESQLRALGYMD